ncbi:hypothetical protein [Tengunoibacter tsumagoiensis]|uniref:Uncharacterized protein n=1 Tax=Tengunoibacter tsumagoiensis TaxID=2014871 RepID=A0A401ZWY6_9CHLR|nr:hypothetical protein [Tengunoibacter tsumagoiensis]GCE11385.1 hypothetical protein KTT_12440 [Tengunoibacter tsumagoiensis]
MKDAEFQPESVEDALDQQLSEQSTSASPAPTQRMVQQLSHLYSASAAREQASLDRVRQRLQQSGHFQPIQSPNQPFQANTSSTKITHMMDYPGRRPQSMTSLSRRRLLETLVALLMVGILVGSFITVFTVLHNSSLAGKPTPTTHATPGQTATQTTPGATQTTTNQTFETTCPAASTSRAAIMPAITASAQNKLIYLTVGSAQSTTVSLNAYNTATRQSTTLFSDPRNSVINAHLSPDGKWILMVVHAVSATDTQDAIELISSNGQDRQTLYCNTDTILDAWMSPDQQTVVFSLPPSNDGGLQAFSLNAAGQVHRITAMGRVTFNAWLDNTHFVVSAHPQTISGSSPTFLIDATKQYTAASDMTIIHQTQNSCTKMTGSANPNVLYISECSISPTLTFQGPTVIRSIPVTGDLPANWPASLWVDQSGGWVTSLQQVDDKTLIFTMDGNHGGIWSVSTDGKRTAKQLYTIAAGSKELALLGDTPYSSGNVSYDGSLYSVLLNNGDAQSLNIGSLQGGDLTQIIQSDNSQHISFAIVGWSR